MYKEKAKWFHKSFHLIFKSWRMISCVWTLRNALSSSLRMAVTIFHITGSSHCSLAKDIILEILLREAVNWPTKSWFETFKISKHCKQKCLRFLKTYFPSLLHHACKYQLIQEQSLEVDRILYHNKCWPASKWFSMSFVSFIHKMLKPP